MSAIKNELLSLSLIFEDCNISFNKLKKCTQEFIHIFSNFSDQRNQSYIKYKLANLIGICFYMALIGKLTSFYYVEQYIQAKPKKFIKLGLVEKGKYPSNDTLMRAFSMLDNKELHEIILKKIKQFYDKASRYKTAHGKEIISGDGQMVRGTKITHYDGSSDYGINVLNLYNVSNAITICSTIVDTKENEIPVLQNILNRLDLKNKIITADALHCQKETVKIVSSKRGDYLFKVKDNQKELKAKITALFKKNNRIKQIEDSNGSYKIIHLNGHEIAPEWDKANSIVLYNSYKRKERKDDSEIINQYFLTSLKDNEEIIETIDKRWTIENGLHKFKDVQLGQDKIQTRNKNALKNMVTMNNIVYAMYRIVAQLKKVTPQRLKIAYEDDPMEFIEVIFPLFYGHNFTNLIKQNMRGTKESKLKK